MSDGSDLQTFQQMIMSFDTPAYMRRARDTEAAWHAVESRCRRQRAAWLKLPTLRLAEWMRDVCHNSSALSGYSVDVRDRLQQLAAECDLPELNSNGPTAAAVVETRLTESFERFNRRWKSFLDSVDLSEVNRRRRDYNQYYVLEKECAVRSAQVAGRGFTPLPPATADDLWKLFPLLPGTHAHDESSGSPSS